MLATTFILWRFVTLDLHLCLCVTSVQVTATPSVPAFTNTSSTSPKRFAPTGNANVTIVASTNPKSISGPLSDTNLANFLHEYTTNRLKLSSARVCPLDPPDTCLSEDVFRAFTASHLERYQLNKGFYDSGPTWIQLNKFVETHPEFELGLKILQNAKELGPPSRSVKQAIADPPPQVVSPTQVSIPSGRSLVDTTSKDPLSDSNLENFLLDYAKNRMKLSSARVCPMDPADICLNAQVFQAFTDSYLQKYQLHNGFYDGGLSWIRLNQFAKQHSEYASTLIMLQTAKNIGPPLRVEPKQQPPSGPFVPRFHELPETEGPVKVIVRRKKTTTTTTTEVPLRKVVRKVKKISKSNITDPMETPETTEKDVPQASAMSMVYKIGIVFLAILIVGCYCWCKCRKAFSVFTRLCSSCSRTSPSQRRGHRHRRSSHESLSS